MGLYQTEVTQIFDDQAIAQNDDATSTALDLSNLREDNMSIQLAITGDGTVNITYIASLNNTDFMAFDGVSNTIATGLTKTSGPGGDGKILINFTPKPCKHIEIVATEQNVDDAIVNAWVLTR